MLFVHLMVIGYMHFFNFMIQKILFSIHFPLILLTAQCHLNHLVDLLILDGFDASHHAANISVIANL